MSNNCESEGLGHGRRNHLNSEKRELTKEFIKHMIRSRDKAFSRFEFWSAEKFEAELRKFEIWQRKRFEENRFEAEREKITYRFILHLQENGTLALFDEWTPEELEAELRKFSLFYFARKEALDKKGTIRVNPPVLDGADLVLNCVRGAPVVLRDPNACRVL